MVTCPAAPVAHTAMLATGLRVRRKPVRTGGDAILHAVSYVDPHGQVVGLGVAAHRDDGRAVAMASEVVQQWAEVMRTRRVTVDAASPHRACSLVAQAHATARRFAAENATVVVIGGATVPPLIAQEPGPVVVRCVEDVDALVIDPAALVAFVVAPGLPVEDAGVLAARLRSRFPGTIGQHPDEFCYAASDRRATVHAVASCSELTVVLGDVPDALVSTAIAAGSRVERLSDAGLLRPEWLSPVASVGILAGDSTRPDQTTGLIEVLSGLGPVSVTRRQVTTELVPAAATPARRAG
jgi:4-hydroxy-3-methylbut-2-enyl diphosphate reductase